MRLRLEAYPAAGQVHTKVWVTDETGAEVLAGELILTLSQWGLFTAAVMLGAVPIKSSLVVELTGDESAVAAFTDTEG